MYDQNFYVGVRGGGCSSKRFLKWGSGEGGH